MSSPAPARFELPITVDAGDTDLLGHVNNIVYLQWVQDVAAGHWRAVATPEEVEAVVWVAVRHEIDYKAPGFPGDEVVVRTWVEAWTAVTSERHTEIVRPADGALLAKARTVWCAVDAASHKPTRVPAQVKERFLGAE